VEYTRSFVLTASELVARTRGAEVMTDRSDLLLDKSIYRVHFRGSVPLKSPGTHTLTIALSRRAAVAHPSELDSAEVDQARIHTFEYPKASLKRECNLHVGLERDAVLPDRILLRGSRFECEWD
jgi:hypothetical protein